MDEISNWSRRAVLGTASAAGAASIVSALTSRDGDPATVAAALEEPKPVSDDFWLGPDRGTSNLDPDAGRVYLALDTAVRYKGNGSGWEKMDVGSSSEQIEAVNTKRASFGGTVLASYLSDDRYVCEAHDTIEDAIDVLPDDGGDIRISPNYANTDEFPVTVDKNGLIVAGLGGTVTIRNDSGNDTFRLHPENERPPGITFRDLTIVQTSGGTAFDVGYSKFNYYENVQAKGPGKETNDDGDGWNCSVSGDWGNNTQTFVHCSASKFGRDGFQFGSTTHHSVMYGCIALANGRFGVYGHNMKDVRLSHTQIEDNDSVGLRARSATDVTASDMYFEANAKNADTDDQTFRDTDVSFVKSVGCNVRDSWFNGRDYSEDDESIAGTWSAVVFDSTSHGGSVHGLTVNGEYRNLVTTMAADTDIHAASHYRELPNDDDAEYIVADTANVLDSAARVRSDGTIIGAGDSNGGNNDLSGVDLSAVTGQYLGDEAVSDGSNTASAGLSARWTGDTWQPSDGSNTISPSR